MYKTYIKRMLDFIFALFLIVFLSPGMLLIAVLIRCSMGKPVLFRQQRVGKDEKIFTILKFRTMNDIRDKNGRILPDGQRQTKLGLFLRSASLDELPELFNILAGDLSFVGPRPLLVKYLPYYTEYERKRHSVRVGLVPPEILYGDITPTWENQFHYEVEYAEQAGFSQDLRILLLTAKMVLKRKSENYGAYSRKSFFDNRINCRENSKTGGGIK